MTRAVWMFSPDPGGESVTLGRLEGRDGADSGAIFWVTESREQAKAWARDLLAGRYPRNLPDDSVGEITDAPPDNDSHLS